ncbi:MAG: hypothetical protein PHW18_08280 [Sulfuricurvum sp.]|uniref:hypothetical protein n=1 Tax=Sulfuricurvum sp. TaxID=2025608 RepID=UPI00263080EF|nr:hypothetical protein [Sulfuricurvum sp.]MDD2829554.1 hypothetical protein [Sulfuricurvum sp.]MDD4950399.1 hypothetical protein [Sulfuricurvum sp.]
MNLQKLKEAEASFLTFYPKGFEDEALLPIIKRHNTAKISESVQEMFAPEKFSRTEEIGESFAKIVSKSSLISLFEKPKVRDMLKAMSMEQQDMFAIGLYELLHADHEKGFRILVDILSIYKLAKWSIVTLIPYYYARDKEFFIKPTTTKDIIKFFEISGLEYKPKPTYEFYARYTQILKEMKSQVSPLIGADNAGFTGFLMMAMK